MSDRVYLTGLWKKPLPNGTTILEGTIKVTPEIREALLSDTLRVEVWPNSRKTGAKPPDFTLSLNTWKRPTEQTPAPPANDDQFGDIPF